MNNLPSEWLIIQKLGRILYQLALPRMHSFTDTRTEDSIDQFWVLEHQPVFTLGHAGDPRHVLDPGEIPVIQSDRGGQVTYHGPGQLVIYMMVDLNRKKMGVRALVGHIESAIVALLGGYGIEGSTRRDAPGVYVGDQKIAALGLRVRRGRSFHGLSLNVDMDLDPFRRINPCGFEGMAVTQLSSLGVRDEIGDVSEKLCRALIDRMAYSQVDWRVLEQEYIYT